MLRLTAIFLAVLLLVPALASADAGDAVIKDCTHNGALTKKYSQKAYQQALAELPADVDEYGDCRQIIRDAQLGVASGGSNGSPAGSIPGVGPAAATPHTPAEKAALAQATSKGDAPVNLATTDSGSGSGSGSGNGTGGKPLVPGASAFDAGGLSHGLPTPVIIVLVLIGVAAVVGALIALRPQIRRVLSRGRG
jgi:hypothetical protein